MKKKKKAKQIQVYMIMTTGQGDTFVKLVDKETWDWIFSPWAPPQAEMSAYQDTACPPSVVARWRKEQTNVEEDEFPYITHGSYENDRALQAQPVYGTTFFSAGLAIKYIARHNCKVVDSYEGYIY